MGRLSREKRQTREGAGRAQAVHLLDLLLCSLNFLMSCDLSQHVRWRPAGEDWAGGGGQGTEPCLLTPPSSNRSLHVCVCGCPPRTSRRVGHRAQHLEGQPKRSPWSLRGVLSHGPPGRWALAGEPVLPWAGRMCAASQQFQPLLS